MSGKGILTNALLCTYDNSLRAPPSLHGSLLSLQNAARSYFKGGYNGEKSLWKRFFRLLAFPDQDESFRLDLE